MNLSSLWYIYVLADPNTWQIRYVGKTTNLALRYQQHLRKYDTSHKSKWIKRLVSCGYRPLMGIVEVGSGAGWEESETYWIDKIRRCGFALTNLATGGEGMRAGSRHSVETREKISKGLAGRPVTAETRAKLRAARLRQGNTRPEYRHSEETKKKIGAARTRQIPPMLGKKHSEETRQKMRKSWELRKLLT